MRDTLRFRSFLFVLFLLGSCSLFAQIEDIDSKYYYIGEGTGLTLEEADNNALQAMFSKISLSFASSFNIVETETNENGNMTTNSTVESIVSSYSQIQGLQNVEQQIVTEAGPIKRVVRYVKRTDVERYFELRRNKAYYYRTYALRAENNAELDVALKYYYWSFCLLRTLPDRNILTNSNGEPLMVWLPEKINSIFRGIRVQQTKKANSTVYLYFTYKGKPVSRLSYSYLGSRYEATDGDGVIYLKQGASTNDLKIKCDYEGEGETQLDEEIDAAVKLMKDKPFPLAEITVFQILDEDEVEEVEKPLTFTERASHMEKEAPLELITDENAEIEPYSKAMTAVVKAIKNGKPENAYSYFTANGKDMYVKLLKYGRARIVTEPDFAFIRHGDEVICRSLKMSFSFKNNARCFIENVNFLFNEQGLIDGLSFSLGDEATAGILLNENYSEEARIVLTQFLENYKTAFALKRLDYIRSIFDDNAIIITGTVTRLSNYRSNEDVYRYMNNEKIRFNRYTKDEYLAKLEKTFKSNEFVNIRFAGSEIRKGGNVEDGELYSIQIKQDYYSSHYGDTGYLFLLVDVNKLEEPLIKVRTWQREPDPKYGLLGPGDF